MLNDRINVVKPSFIIKQELNFDQKRFKHEFRINFFWGNEQAFRNLFFLLIDLVNYFGNLKEF